MRFLDDNGVPPYDLTYDDVFMVPRRSSVGSRYDVDLATSDGTGTTIPLVVANMTAVSGRRMAETIARRGGLAVIPQDIPVPVVREVVSWVKTRHLVFDTPITLGPDHTVADAMALIPKRSHRAAFVVRDGRPVGVVTEEDCRAVDRFTQVHQVMSTEVNSVTHDADPRTAFEQMDSARRRVAPVVDAQGSLVGVLTRTAALRATLYDPAVDAQGRLRVAAAVGVNGDVAAKAEALLRTGGWTVWSSTPRTDTRTGCSRRSLRCARWTRRCRSSPATWSLPRAPAISSRRVRTSSRSGSGRERCARRA